MPDLMASRRRAGARSAQGAYVPGRASGRYREKKRVFNHRLVACRLRDDHRTLPDTGASFRGIISVIMTTSENRAVDAGAVSGDSPSLTGVPPGAGRIRLLTGFLFRASTFCGVTLRVLRVARVAALGCGSGSVSAPAPVVQSLF